jgi:hypothetical protein
MLRRGAAAALDTMTDHEDDLLERAAERSERRLAEECGKLRVEMAQGFGALRAEMEKGTGALRAEMERGFGVVRAEMIDRNATLLKWLPVYAVTQMAAIAALLRLFR